MGVRGKNGGTLWTPEQWSTTPNIFCALDARVLGVTGASETPIGKKTFTSNVWKGEAALSTHKNTQWRIQKWDDEGEEFAFIFIVILGVTNSNWVGAIGWILFLWIRQDLLIRIKGLTGKLRETTSKP